MTTIWVIVICGHISSTFLAMELDRNVKIANRSHLFRLQNMTTIWVIVICGHISSTFLAMELDRKTKIANHSH